MRLFVLLHLIALLALAGCGGGIEKSALPVPTLAAAPSTGDDLDSADQVARFFLDAWQRGDDQAIGAPVSWYKLRKPTIAQA